MAAASTSAEEAMATGAMGPWSLVRTLRLSPEVMKTEVVTVSNWWMGA